MPEVSNPYDEINALAAGIATALNPSPMPDGRIPVVRNRPWSRTYTGGYPVVAVSDDIFRLDRILPSYKGQAEGRESYYAVDIMDPVPSRSDDPEKEGNTITGVLLIVKAILVWFNFHDNQCLFQMVERAGEHMEMRNRGDFIQTSDGDDLIVRTLAVSVRGIKHRDIRTP